MVQLLRLLGRANVVTDAPFEPVAELIPHSGPMCLLDRVVEHSPETTICAVDPGASSVLARPDGSVPAWVALEYMAQCVAVHGGLAARARGEDPRPGLLLGSRRLRFDARDFAPGDELRVSVRHHAGERGLVVFDCAVARDCDAAPLVQGRLNVYILDDWRQLGTFGAVDG
jgi:predicted hotdog family 3-hydroxylacyl-ACP dehydratase